MSSWVASNKSSGGGGGGGRSDLSSCWIRRLCPPSTLNTIPLLVPPHRHPHPQEVDVVRSSEVVTGFGPFRLMPSKNPPPPPPAEVCSFYQHRRLLATGILGNTTQPEDDGRVESRFPINLRHARELNGEPPSQLPPVCFQMASTSSVATGQGYASLVKGRDDNHPVATARRHFYNPHAFGPNSVWNPSERQSYGLSSKPEEPFSYWNMGRPERRNVVCSVYPAASSPITVSRKRSASTHGCSPSKFGRFLQ